MQNSLHNVLLMIIQLEIEEYDQVGSRVETICREEKNF